MAFQDRTGAWFEMAEMFPEPKMVGAVTGTGADQVEAIEATLAASKSGLIMLAGVYPVSRSIRLGDGNGIIGTSRHESGLITTEADAAWGTREGVLIVDGEGCKLANIGLNGHRATLEWLEDRTSGIFMTRRSKKATIVGVDSSYFTKHGIAVLGSGHVLVDISADACGADNVAIGDGVGASDCVMSGARLGGSIWRSAFEVDDGSTNILIDDFEIVGSFPRERAAINISDHGGGKQQNKDIVIRNGSVSVLGKPARGAFQVASLGNVHRDILIENVEVSGNLKAVLYNRGGIDGLMMRNIRGNGSEAFAMTQQYDRAPVSKNFSFLDCDALCGYGAPDFHMPGVDGVRVGCSRA